MAFTMAMLKCTVENNGSMLCLRRFVHAIAPINNSVIDRIFSSPPLLLPESDRTTDGKIIGFHFPSFVFSGSMELMAVPKRKTSPHKRGIRNGPKALKPTPVIVRCRSSRKSEPTFIKHLSKVDRREGMKSLRPKVKREKHNITFFSGFFSGCLIALVIAAILNIEARNLTDKEEGTLYMENIFPLYSLYSFIVLHMLMYAGNIFVEELSSQLSLSIGIQAGNWVGLVGTGISNRNRYVQAIMSFMLYICYYGLGEFSRTQNKCHNHDAYNAFYFIVAALPYWIRFLQVLNIILRLAWMQLVLEFNLHYVHKMFTITIVSCLQIIRRGIWNIFHVGKRAAE